MALDTPQLLSLLSHELRGPVGVIRGYMRLLTQGGDNLSERSQQAIAAALRASDRVAEILDEASLFAHLDRGDVRLEQQDVPLEDICLAAMAAADLPETTDVVLVNDSPDATLHADAKRLTAALATLIAAIARARPNEAEVAVRAVRVDRDKRATVRVRIAAGTLAEADATDGELNIVRGGSGLAIPVAAAIVAAHGGRVRELRQGERLVGFVATIPIAQDYADHADSAGPG